MIQNSPRSLFFSLSGVAFIALLALFVFLSGRAAIAHQVSATPLLQVPTVPTVPTIPTVPTVPTIATATPTVMPTDDGDNGTQEEGLDPIGGPLVGNYCLATGGIGLRANANGSFALNVVGTPVYAYLVWAGRYPDNAPDNNIGVAINGGLPITVVAADDRQSELKGGISYFTFLSANLVNQPSFAGLLSGALTVNVSGLNSGNGPGNEGYGVGLIIVSTGANCPFSQIDLAYGLDSFFDDGSLATGVAANQAMAPQGLLGPNSAVRCVAFPAAGATRTLNFHAFVGGVDPNQTNALWYTTGTGAKPTELITNNSGMVLAGPPATITSPFSNNAGSQFDSYTNNILVPAGATFACFQIESAPTDLNSATEAVWVTFVSQLLSNVTVTPTPTSTPSATPTGAPTVPTVPTVPPVPGASGLTIDIAVEPLDPEAGDDVIFTVSYTNSGSVTVPNVQLTFVVPNNTTFNSGASTAGWNCTGITPGSVCRFDLGNVDPSESGKVRFVVTVDTLVSATNNRIQLTVKLVDNAGKIYSEKTLLLLANALQRMYVPFADR